MKHLATLVILCCSGNLFSQETILKDLLTLEDVDRAQRAHPEVQVRLEIRNTQDNDFPEVLFGADYEEIVQSDDHFYKLIDKRTSTEFRAQYIFLDGKSRGVEQCKGIQQLVLDQYAEGTSFAELAAKYSDDQAANGGDLGWFGEGVMIAEFEEAIKAHKKGDIYTTFSEKRLWYFVVLKTHNDREKGRYKYIEVAPHDITFKSNEGSKKRLNISLSYEVKKKKGASNIEITKLECFNCKDTLNDKVLAEKLSTAFEKADKKIVDEKQKGHETHTASFRFLLK